MRRRCQTLAEGVGTGLEHFTVVLLAVYLVAADAVLDCPLLGLALFQGVGLVLLAFAIRDSLRYQRPRRRARLCGSRPRG